MVRKGKVNKTAVDILVDTACSRALLRRGLLPEDFAVDQEYMPLLYWAHGDVASYPTAWIHLEINGKHCNIRAGVANMLPRPVLLSHNIGDLNELITNNRLI